MREGVSDVQGRGYRLANVHLIIVLSLAVRAQSPANIGSVHAMSVHADSESNEDFGLDNGEWSEERSGWLEGAARGASTTRVASVVA